MSCLQSIPAVVARLLHDRAIPDSSRRYVNSRFIGKFIVGWADEGGADEGGADEGTGRDWGVCCDAEISNCGRTHVRDSDIHFGRYPRRALCKPVVQVENQAKNSGSFFYPTVGSSSGCFCVLAQVS